MDGLFLNATLIESLEILDIIFISEIIFKYMRFRCSWDICTQLLSLTKVAENH